MSSRHWSPYQIEIILHHYCSPSIYPATNQESYDRELAWMSEHDILRRDGQGILRPTAIGEALVELWLQTPLPRQIIIDPRDRKEISRPEMQIDPTRPADGASIDWMRP